MSGVADTKASMSRPSTARQSVAEMKRHQATKAAAKLAITGGAALAKEGEEECQEMLQSIAEIHQKYQDEQVGAMGDLASVLVGEAVQMCGTLSIEFSGAKAPQLHIDQEKLIKDLLRSHGDIKYKPTPSVITQELKSALLQVPDLIEADMMHSVEEALISNLEDMIQEKLKEFDSAAAEKYNALQTEVQSKLALVKTTISKTLAEGKSRTATTAQRMKHQQALTYDEVHERAECAAVYKLLDIQFKILDDCEVKGVEMRNYRANHPTHGASAAAWGTDPDAAAMVAPAANTVDQQIAANDKIIADAKYQCCRLVCGYAKRAPDPAFAKRDTLDVKDLQELKAMKLTDCEAQEMTNGKKIFEIMLSGMIRRPFEYAAILPAFIAFGRSNVSINTMECPTFAAMNTVEHAAVYPDPMWGMMSEATTQRVIQETAHMATKMSTALAAEWLQYSTQMEYGEEDTDRGIVKCNGVDICGASYFEIFKWNAEYLSGDQIEMHKMHVINVLKLFYDSSVKLEDALIQAQQIVRVAIEFNAEHIQWRQTGGMWAKAVAANFTALATEIGIQDLRKCPDEELSRDCVTLLPDVLNKLKAIAVQARLMETMPSIVASHSMMLVGRTDGTTDHTDTGWHGGRGGRGGDRGGRGGRGRAPRGGSYPGGTAGDKIKAGGATWGHFAAPGTFTMSQEQKEKATAKSKQLFLPLNQAHHQCDVHGCPNVDLSEKDALAYRNFAYKFKPPHDHLEMLPQAKCGSCKKKGASGQVMKWKDGAHYVTQKTYDPNKKKAMQSANLATEVVADDPTELDDLRKAKQIAAELAAIKDREIARLMSIQSAQQQSVQQSVPQQQQWTPSQWNDGQYGGQWTPQATMAQFAHQQQMMPMVQQPWGGAMVQQEGVPPAGQPTMQQYQIPGQPALQDKESAGIQARPQPAIQGTMRLDEAGNIIPNVPSNG